MGFPDPIRLPPAASHTSPVTELVEKLFVAIGATVVCFGVLLCVGSGNQAAMVISKVGTAFGLIHVGASITRLIHYAERETGDADNDKTPDA